MNEKASDKTRESVSHLGYTGALVLLRLLEGMQGDAGPSGAGVTPLVEQCPHPEPLLPSLISLSYYML